MEIFFVFAMTVRVRVLTELGPRSVASIRASSGMQFTVADARSVG